MSNEKLVRVRVREEEQDGLVLDIVQAVPVPEKAGFGRTERDEWLLRALEKVHHRVASETVAKGLFSSETPERIFRITITDEETNKDIWEVVEKFRSVGYSTPEGSLFRPYNYTSKRLESSCFENANLNYKFSNRTLTGEDE